MTLSEKPQRKPRQHKRVVYKGKEKFTVSLSEFETGPTTQQKIEAKKEEERLLRELPPHFSLFSAERDQAGV
ncbi:MAG TPA: hypothetical protein K8U78_00495 [Aeriscardovia aeriphila]|uniref:Uncharacterized protein n=1 Tax=Aeriscardovia aeriphila TaxID=218139 RepID=A0A921FVK0_9BIFI|nr:hypothetical protein [Aeriscardovia aeriphila]